MAEASHGPSRAKDEQETYKQRKGTRSVGDKYENIMLALYALRFSLNKNVKDMSIESNVDGFGAFDDVKLHVEYHTKETKLYLIQLKHKEKENYPITKSELLSSKNHNFSLDKYKKSYYKVRSKLDSEGYNLDKVMFCLVTNANLPNISTISFEPSHVICHLVSNSIQNLQEDYIHTKSKNFFTFNIQSPSTKEEHEYSTFFRHFRIYDKQVNYKEAENEIVSLLETSFGVKNPEITKTFIRFIEAECEENRPLTKKNVKIKLLELLTGVTEEIYTDAVKTEEMLPSAKYETFEDITDLNNYDERVKILKEISISLQGRTAVNLYDLTNKSFHETVSVSFLLKNIKETVNVGKEFLKRPDNYIERRFYKILLEKEILWKTTKMIFLLDTPLPPALTGEIKILTDLETNNFPSFRFTDENLAVIVSTNTFSETIKCIKKHRDLTSFSLHHVKVHDTSYLEWQRSWSNRDDLSKFIVYDESVKEEEILKYFKSNLNVVSAIPGMGKTTILNTLAHYCEPDVLALKLDLNTHETHLINEDSELRQNPLNYICERMQTGENSEIEKKLFKHLKEENRLILFVDAFDEISPTHSNAVLSIIEKLKENQIPTWIFTRPLVMSILQKHFSVVPFNMVPLGNDDIKNYLIQTVGEERDEEVDSSLTDNVLNLCSAPLYLNMFAAIIREKQVNLRNPKMTDLYEHFTEMSFENYMKKRNLDENRNLFIGMTEDHRNRYIKDHKTAALVVIFGENYLLENKILKEKNVKSIRDFNTGKKNYELIVSLDDGTPTFSHRTYAEYFAALKIYEYLQENKFLKLYERLFEENYQGVRAMFYRISAKTLPLHLAVVEEDYDKVERLCDDLSSSKIHERDEFGRTVLHFAMNSCKFSDLPVEENVPIKIVDLLMRHCKKDKAIFKECDYILDLNFYEYAKKCESVNLLHLAAYHGSRNIIECLIDMKDPNIDFKIKSEMGKTPIHCAAENGFFDIVTLLKDNGGNIDETDQDGLTVLHHAIYKQDEESVDLLIKAGADVNYKTKDKRAPIHYAAEKYLLGQGSNIIKLLKEKGGRIDDVDIKGMTPLHYASESGLQHCVVCLKNEDANLNPKENKGRTPMHLAAKNGHVDVMKVLKKEDKIINEKIINDTDSEGFTALHYASYFGHEDCVQYLISKDADVNKKTNCSDTPMHIAARRGYVDVIRLLKDKGGIINAVDRCELTPLHYAAKTGRMDCFKCLTESGADTSKIDAFGKAPIHYAAEFGNVDVIKHLIKHENVNIYDVDLEGSTAIHYAAHNGRIKCLDFLLKEGAVVNQKAKEGRTPMQLGAKNGNVDVMKVKEDEVINDTDSKGCTALHYASDRGHEDCVQYLISKGADVNKKTKELSTPVHYAAKGGYVGVIRLLKDKGGIINAVDRCGLTPLHYAAKTGHMDCFKYLTESGADTSNIDAFGKAPIHYAAEFGNVDVIKHLIKYENVNINVVDSEGSTPIHYAALKGRIKCLDFLLKEGADVNQKTKDGRTPMHLAAKNGYVDVMKVLQKEDEINEKIINDTDSKGWTALHYASDCGHEDCVQYLISKGADVNKKTNCSDTPMHCAAHGGYVDVIRLLKYNGGIIDEADNDGLTPLHYAAINGRPDCFKYLTESGGGASKSDALGKVPIHYAAEYGNVDVIKHLINHENVDIYDVDSEGSTAIHYAAHNGRIKCLDFLLKEGAVVNQKAKEGRTPMQLGAKNGNVDVMKVREDDIINDTDSKGCTALYYASDRGHEDCVQYLISKGADVNKKTKKCDTPMHIAARRGYVGVIRLLKGKDGIIDAVNRYGLTPLHYAAKTGRIDCFQCLTESGADTSKSDAFGSAPIHYAAQYGNVDVIEYLINHENVNIRVSSNEKSSDGRTPMHYAAEKGHVDIIKSLKKKDAETDAVDSKGMTPLHYAALEGNINCISYLIKSSEDINKKAIDDGRTPVHCSAVGGHVDVLKYLKDNGGNIYETDSMGMTPLHYASQNGYTKCVEYLLKENLERNKKEQDGKPEDIDGLKRLNKYVNKKSAEGRTPLHYAALNRHPGTVRLLLKEKGVRIDETDSMEMTALHHAVRLETTDCLNLLLEAGADVNIATTNGTTPTHSAALGGYVDVIRLLKDKGGIIDKFDRYGLTPLHYAAKTGRIDCFEYLTESDEDFYISDPLGMTPIHYAAENGHIDVIKYLKHKNVNITGIDSEGLTALHYATRNGQVKCVRYLIEEKFDVNKSTNLGETPMSYAVQRNYVNVISLLIEKEARITDFNSEGLTVLHYAAQHGCKHSLAYLLESGASSKQKSRDDRTPMHYAAENGHVDIIKLLKKKDAEIDAVDSKGLIPLHYAAREGNIKCINHLIKSSEDINKKAIDGGTPAHFSAEGGHVDVLKSLKEKGGNINETDSLGQTALHYASCKGQTKCVEYLLGQCLDVNGKDSNGKTPMHCAAENGHLEVIRVLKEKYGNVNETDMLGRTPFHFAKINGHANCMKYLIRAGATIDQKVCDGSTPLSLAVENGHADAVKLLEDEGAIV